MSAVLSAAVAGALKWPWAKPPPPPVIELTMYELAAPVLLAVLGGWLLPALLFLWSTGSAKQQSSTPQGEAALFSAKAPGLKTPSTAEGVADSKTEKATPVKKEHPGVFYGSLSVFVMVASAAISFPFVQSRRDALGCDALCQGGQTSLRSALGLVGASMIGRASDTMGRVPMLWVGIIASLASLTINITMDNLEGLWLSLIPAALFNQNFSVAKALLSDYIDEVGGSDAERAGAVGKLGMAVGFAFMFGPIVATLLVKEYTQAVYASAAGTLLAAGVLLLLPTPKTPAGKSANISTVSSGSRAGNAEGSAAATPADGAVGDGLTGPVTSFLSMPVLQSRGAQLLMAVRLLMAFAFHMYAPIWQVSIKKRFDFGPRDHAQFMGLIGLTYALSQGLVAKPMIRRAGSDPTRLLLLCIFLLGGARPFALFTSSVGVVYVLYVPMVIGLGVMNTAITTACSGLADGDQLGGLFGVLESVESVAGMMGPALGGLLSTRYAERGTLTAVVTCYGLAFMLIGLFFGKHVVAAGKAKAKQA